MSTNEDHSIEKSIGKTLRSLGEESESFLDEGGLARAIQCNQQLAANRTECDEDRNELTKGDRLGEFEIVEKVAQGGMGVIYSAIQSPLGRKVALKTIIPSKTNEFTLERFRRERTILGELHESNVVSVFAAGTDRGIEYFAMPYINGKSLKEIVNDDNRRNRSDIAVVQTLVELADGVESIHEQGVIHRDITPNNVLLDEGCRPWLIDFGIATKVETEGNLGHDSEVYQLSTDGRLGTPRYKAPELEAGSAGRPTDVYGIGICFYCLLTSSDFPGDDSERFTNRDQISELRSLNSSLAAICTKALLENPKKRYQTAAELAEDLRRWIRNEPVSAKAYPVHQRLWLWLKRNPIKSIVIAASFLLLAVVAIAAVTNAQSKANEDAAKLKSRLSQMESILLAGDFDRAESLLAGDSDMLEISSAEDPNLFLDLVSLLGRRRGIGAAQLQIEKARLETSDKVFLARLDLAEADILYSTDFDKSERLANDALSTGHLSPIEVDFAKALLAKDAIEEQMLLIRVVRDDPFHLRAQQLLAMNYVFLGMEQNARTQVASGRALFPNDPSLLLAEAFLIKMFSSNDLLIRNGKITTYGPLIGHQLLAESDFEFAHRVGEAPNWKDAPDTDKTLHSILDLFPKPTNLQHSNHNIVVDAVDKLLISLCSVQDRMAETGVVILPPALYRALSRFEQPGLPNTDSRYWLRLEPGLKKLSTANPDMLFLFAHARTFYSRPDPDVKEWMQAERFLEQALSANSMFPIRPIVVQQLAYCRVQIYYYASARDEQAKTKMIEGLHLLNNEGRLPEIDGTYFANVVEASFESGELDLAKELCGKWRIATEKGTADQKANALGYSAMVALRRERFHDALDWSSKAIELAPNHKFNKAHRSFRDQATEKLEMLLDSIESEK